MMTKTMGFTLIFANVVITVILFLSIIFSFSGCRDPMVSVLKAKYPNCDVLKVEEEGSYTKATIQCPGNDIKEVKIKKNER